MKARQKDSAAAGSLREYARKRNFAVTAEPSGKRASASHEGARFVIQKHAASRMHYDFRLEVDGALKSWAVPKGIPSKKGDKRLAVQVEDHPLDYADFEGIIPDGQYGGGTVMVWDRGTYESLGGPKPSKDIAEGKLHFELHGKKLNGEWTLVHIKRGKGNEWLLIKSGDDIKAISKKKDDLSSLSGRTMAQIARDRDAEWPSNHKTKPLKAGAKLPSFVVPMMAKLVASPPSDGGWLYELKYDGYRALTLCGGSRVKLFSRTQKELSKRFPEIVDGMNELAAQDAIFDGEIVALDPKGRPAFELLQGLDLGERPPLVYYIFDLIRYGGVDLSKKSIDERRKLFKKRFEERRRAHSVFGFAPWNA